MKVIIREAAYDDLDRISVWIAKDRPRSADSVIDRILESAERLGHFPYCMSSNDYGRRAV
jgi:plasmid stabilization system protein ParE